MVSRIYLFARSDAYIKIAKKNGSRLLPSRSILRIANSMPTWLAGPSALFIEKVVYFVVMKCLLIALF